MWRAGPEEEAQASGKVRREGRVGDAVRGHPHHRHPRLRQRRRRQGKRPPPAPTDHHSRTIAYIVYTYACICIHTYMCMYIYIYTYICIYVCVYMYIVSYRFATLAIARVRCPNLLLRTGATLLVPAPVPHMPRTYICPSLPRSPSRPGVRGPQDRLPERHRQAGRGQADGLPQGEPGLPTAPATTRPRVPLCDDSPHERTHQRSTPRHAAARLPLDALVMHVSAPPSLRPSLPPTLPRPRASRTA